MRKVCIRNELIESYQDWLEESEKSPATIQSYLLAVKQFIIWLKQQSGNVSDQDLKEGVMQAEMIVTKEMLVAYKEHCHSIYKFSSVNAKLTAINSFLRVIGHEEFCVHLLKHQRILMQNPDTMLERNDYERLLKAAKESGRERLYMVLQTIGGTGIRVSELRYITVEAVRERQANIQMKGKLRVIVIERKLAEKLLSYCTKCGITDGSIFITKSGNPIGRSNLWKEMQRLGIRIGLKQSKLHPHNLRHLFARTYYQNCRDVVYLADILGHSNINTTRIYTSISWEEHDRVLSGLNLT